MDGEYICRKEIADNICSNDMEEKETKQSSTASETPVREKKLTKYDLKMQRRQEEAKKAAKRRKQSLAVLAVIIIAVVAIFAYRAYDNYVDEHGDYIVVGEHGIKKAEYNYYFYNVINSFYSTYGSFISYLGLDFSEDLASQSYTSDYTWQDYFDMETVSQIQTSYALLDEATAAGFEYDTTEDYEALLESIEEYAAEEDMTVAEYVESMYGTGVTLDSIESYIKDNYYISAYYDYIEESTEVTADEIVAYYEENSDSYDSVDYLICKIAAVTEDEEEEAEETEADDAEDADSEETEETEEETEAETLSEEEQAELEAAEEEAAAAALAEALAKAEEMASLITDEDSFAELFALYNTDEDTEEYAVTGATYSYTSPTVVATWLFDSERQAGDVDVIEYEYGECYYVVYFVGRYLETDDTLEESEQSWYTSIESTLLSEKMSEWLNEIADKMTVTDKRKNIAYLHYNIVQETEAETESETETETE